MRINGIRGVSAMGRAIRTQTSEVNALASAIFRRVRIAERLGRPNIQVLLANDDVSKAVLDRIKKLYKNVDVNDSNTLNVKISFNK